MRDMFKNNNHHDSINTLRKKKKAAPSPPATTNTKLSFLHSTDHGASDPDVNHYDSYPVNDKFYDNRPRTGTYKKCKAPPPPRQVKLQQMFQSADSQTPRSQPTRLIGAGNQDNSENVVPNNNNQVMQVFQYHSSPKTIKSSSAPAPPTMTSSSSNPVTSSRMYSTSPVLPAIKKTVAESERSFLLPNKTPNAVTKNT